jgi:hypothetical protein
VTLASDIKRAAIGAADLETAVPWRHPDLNPACITVAGRSDEDWARALVPRTNCPMPTRQEHWCWLTARPAKPIGAER